MMVSHRQAKLPRLLARRSLLVAARTYLRERETAVNSGLVASLENAIAASRFGFAVIARSDWTAIDNAIQSDISHVLAQDPPLARSIARRRTLVSWIAFFVLVALMLGVCIFIQRAA
jgi:hypothetical protein